ncbi:MAG: Nif3-like dinuclear metal center hexameric protein [Bacteroidales bacterium]
MKVKEIISLFESIAPLSLQEEYDNSGIQIGDIEKEISACLLCMDVTEEVIDEAIEKGCGMIISHHPLLFKPVKSITGASYVERCIIKAIKNEIAVYAGHTNFDKVHGGVSFLIGRKLGLTQMTPLAEEENQLDGLGVIGRLENPISLGSFLQQVKTQLNLSTIRSSDQSERMIQRVALCGGSGSSLAKYAMAKKADLYLTADLSYHDFYLNTPTFTVADFGHYESEYVIIDYFREIITNKLPNFAVLNSASSINPINYI